MASKSAKKANKKVEKVELSESVNKIKDTATKVNAQVLETASEVMDDVRVNGKYWVETATKRVEEVATDVKDAVVNFDVEKTTKAGIKTATKVVKNVNEFALETADDVVDGALKNGKKIQGIAAKAIEGGLKITAKQQDIVFDTLETVKGQLTKSAERFRDLFKAN
ncbi:MAG: hypothetical protein AAF573_15580 [Bacteroidota bacterium]